jgi:hypothetical protein
MRPRTPSEENLRRYRSMAEGELAEAMKQVRLGNRELITPLPGYQLNCYNSDVPNRAMSRPKMLFGTNILRVTEEDLQDLSYLPGAWALTIDGRPTVNTVSPDYPGDFPVSPLMAEVTFGTGAAAHKIELDAVRNTIVFPAMDVNVDVGISQVIGNQAIAQNYGLFNQYEVKAVLHRVGSGVESQATRSYIIGSWYPTLPIPAFATAWTFASFQPLAFGDAIGVDPATEWWSDDDAAAFGIAESVPADIYSNNARNHCFRPYHPLAKSITLPLLIDGAGPGTLWPGTLINRLEF